MQESQGTMRPLDEEEVKKEKQKPIHNQRPVFSVGEMLEIKGGSFRVIKLGHKSMKLKSIGYPTDKFK